MVTWRGTTVLMDGTCECVFNYQITSRAEKHIKVVYPTRLLGWVLEKDHGAVINGYGCIYDGHNNIIICSHFPWLGFIYPWVVKEMKGHKQKETIKHSLISIINKMIFRGREILGSKQIIPSSGNQVQHNLSHIIPSSPLHPPEQLKDTCRI